MVSLAEVTGAFSLGSSTVTLVSTLELGEAISSLLLLQAVSIKSVENINKNFFIIFY